MYLSTVSWILSCLLRGQWTIVDRVGLSLMWSSVERNGYHLAQQAVGFVRKILMKQVI